MIEELQKQLAAKALGADNFGRFTFSGDIALAVAIGRCPALR